MNSEKLHNHPRIEMMQVDYLNQNKRNPRKHSEKQMVLLTNSIARFGFVGVVIIDDGNNILAGNAKVEAAKRAGITEVPCLRRQFIDETCRRSFILTDNRLAEEASWDPTLLSEELNFLFEHEYDFEVTGFGLADMDFSIGGDNAPSTEKVELPAANAAAVSQAGDLWLIGEHRLYCGDARSMDAYEKLLGNDKANMIFADAPYNVRIDGHVSGLGTVKHREFQHASGEMSPAEFTMFLRGYMQCCAMYSGEGSIHYHCMDWRHMREMLDAGEGVYGKLKQLAVWNKGVGSMGTFYRSQHELVFIFKSGKAKHINNFGLGDTGRYRTNVWDYAGANTFSKGRKRDLEDHPTVKSLSLVMDAILDCSNRGDVILDPFSGSGTTLIAAHKTRRRGAAIEIDPIYVDTALKRVCEATGLVATHEDGRTFEEVSAARALVRETDNV